MRVRVPLALHRVRGAADLCARRNAEHPLRVPVKDLRLVDFWDWRVALRMARPMINRSELITSESNVGDPMLELRPSCEHCNKALPPDSLEARICSYECTFCVACVDNLLDNVCPNCGGGFVPRPIRPSRNWKGDNFLGKDPASTKIKHRPVDTAAHARFSSAIRTIPPHER
jgi:hypothetical protein